jgi:hypothetical protein
MSRTITTSTTPTSIAAISSPRTPARVISFNPENPSSLKVAAAGQPRRFAWSVLPLDLGRDRLGRVVGLAQTRVHARP